MALPNRPEKFQSEPVVSPERSVAYHGTDDPSPTGLIVCYTEGLLEYVIDTFDGETNTEGFGTLHRLEAGTGDIGVLGGFGIGAPATAIAIEECLATGTETILSIGYAGCLAESIAMGDFVIPDKALRDEGTSHHYTAPERWIEPPGSFHERLLDHLVQENHTHHVGPTWTTDAVYRETEDEVAAYADEGILTVEMEAAAVFAIAAHRNAEAASMFIVSDYLGPSEWEPQFHQTEADMHRLMDTAIESLEAYLE